MPSFSSKKRPDSPNRPAHAARTLVAAACVLLIVAGCVYIADWYVGRAHLKRVSERYSALYDRSSATAAPAATPAPTAEPLPQVLDVPLTTPDSQTRVYSLPTPPPVQESFSQLLNVNSETVGFLHVGSIVSLPVVQRENDNEFYLNHNFEGEESSEGTLFLDGLNRLVPEDDCLIVYGHNMHNGAMFGNLRSYLNRDFFRSNAIVSFDTLYENRTYVPFAAFNASMDSAGRNAFDLRRFVMDRDEFDDFIASLRAHSEFSVPLDVSYGDRLLLLVTCDYSNRDGRFILALRALRSGESAEETAALVAQAVQQ